ncbi:MAG TPA: hypothetical protein VJB96_01755 [Patescibacteria group bacterium]|nr:hypothetical protein [Patescibacteria group bacterium]
MKKLFAWLSSYWLSLAALVLLAFIPLYPKLPLVDIKNTWVYIRAEDFVVLFVLFGWVLLFFRNRVSIRTPLTIPILFFWFVGAVSTLHSILFIAPTVFEIYPNVAFLGYLRRIEYMSLFFVAFSAVRDKKYLSAVASVLVCTVGMVILYGIGQRYFALPAYLTMNEEFAKGVPLTLSSLGRISSTFGGHYDLAAYLVLTIPIVVSLMLGLKHWFLKIALGIVTALGGWVLFMTVSRISLLALVVACGIVLWFQRKKLIVVLVPAALIGVVILISFTPQILERFGSTLKQVDVLVDAKTGHPIGHVKDVPSTYFENSVIWQLFYDTIGDVLTHASPSARFQLTYKDISSPVVLLTEPTAPTGEDLPSGTSYINLTLSPDIRRVDHFLYEPQNKPNVVSGEAFVINGEYIVKRAYAYDLSFTTRFQGEWPKAIAAFKRNIFLGSGYGSVSLAVDNSYLRMLAEVGMFGFVFFLSIFLMVGLLIVKTVPKIDSPLVKSFVWGYVAGIAGLAINALFIDVFEASKVAFVLWVLTGTVVGVLMHYERMTLRFFAEVTRVVTSPYAIIVYVLLIIIILFSPLTTNYFVGDDFTWLRWAAGSNSLLQHLTESAGFFYRPGTKVYFDVMYRLVWLNQNAYHIVSLALHFVVSIMVFILANRILKKLSLATLAAVLFASLSGFSEAVFWISATGHLFAVMFMLASLLFYASWREKKRFGYVVGVFVSFILALLFYEMAVVTPLLLLLYEWTTQDKPRFSWSFFVPIPVYGLMRWISASHWFAGDYNVNLLKFPLNAVGNVVGYVMVALVGPFGSPMYEAARNVLREHAVVAVFLGVAAIAFVYWIIRIVRQTFPVEEKRVCTFAGGFFLISLLPFMGLGNIAPRYGYLSAVGIVIFLAFVIGKLYAVLLSSGREIAKSGVAVVITTLLMINSVGFHGLQQDWHNAGEMVQRFLVTLDSNYQDYWKDAPMEFHFVNVPIRYQDAWVFPVGLSDALWFVLRNPGIRVYTWPSVDLAFTSITYGSTTQKVFVFNDEGQVTLVHKPPPEFP